MFNSKLRKELDDTACEHCRFYLTTGCPHLDEFLQDVAELETE